MASEPRGAFYGRGVQIRNGNINLHVADDGDASAAPIVLLHGITSFGGTWNWIVPALAERFRVLRLDFRGHGRSDRAPGEYTTDGYVSDAIAVCEQVAGQPCLMMGHSLGGGTAGAVAQQRPDLLRCAILEDPPLGSVGTAEGSLEGNTLLDGFRLMRQSIPALQESKIPLAKLVQVLAAAPDTTGSSTFGESLHADGLETMAGSLLEVDASVLDPVLDGTSEPFLDLRRPIDVPTLIVTADPVKPDAVASPVLAQRLADASSTVEVLTIAGAGHLVHDEVASRDTFRSAVIDFIDRLAAT